MDRLRNIPADQSLRQVLAEIVADTRAFLHTRAEMLRRELQENIASWKVALPVAATAIVLLGTAYFLFVAALVVFITTALPANAFRWAIALTIVGIIWSIPGCVMAYFAVERLRRPPLVPRKTLQVLKADKEWIESEIKAA